MKVIESLLNEFFQGLNRVESMGTLSHRALLQYLDVGDIQGLKNYLENRALQVDDRDDNGTTLLMVASGRGTVSFVKELIAFGADVQAVDLDNWSPLLYAAKGGYLEVIEILVEHGADIEHKDMVSLGNEKNYRGEKKEREGKSEETER